MVSSLSAKEESNKDNQNTDITFPEQVASHQETFEPDPSSNDMEKSLLEAQKNAMSAKEAAMEAINQVYKESEASAETLAKVINEVIQCNTEKTNELRDTYMVEPEEEAEQENFNSGTSKQYTEPTKSGLVQKVLYKSYHPFHTLLGNKSANTDLETREELNNPVISPDQQLYQLIDELDELTKEKTQGRIEKIIEEAETTLDKAEIIKRVAEGAVSQEREEIIKAREEAEMVRRSTEMAISQATQEAMSQVADDITEAKEEVRAAKEAAEIAIRQANDETIKSREQIKAVNNHAQMAIAAAQEKVKAISEEMEAIRRQSQIDARQAQAEAIKVKEEAESVKKMAQEATTKAEEESRKVKEEAEAKILRANELMTQAQQYIINMTKAEITKTRQEIETVSKNPEVVLKKPLEAGAESDDYLSHFDEMDAHLAVTILREMHTPLHSLSDFARLMLEDDISDSTTQRELLSIIVQQSERLHRLLDDLSSVLEHNHNDESYIV